MKKRIDKQFEVWYSVLMNVIVIGDTSISRIVRDVLYEESNSTECTYDLDYCDLCQTTFVIKPLEYEDHGVGLITKGQPKDWEFRRKNNYKQKRRK
jgi:hypothetical protein